jgi:hypothetical protein
MQMLSGSTVFLVKIPMKPAMCGCHRRRYATTTPQDWVECAVFATVKVLQAAKSSHVIPHSHGGTRMMEKQGSFGQVPDSRYFWAFERLIILIILIMLIN